MTLRDLAGIGPKRALAFAALEIETPRDLLEHFPFRYDDLREATPAVALGARGGEENAVGTVIAVRERRARTIEIVEVDLRDESGVFCAKWIGRNRYAIGRFKVGMRLFVRGRVERSLSGPVISVGTYRMLGPDERYRGALVPIYHAVRELNSKTIAAAIARNFPRLLEEAPPDPIPPAALKATGYDALEIAYRSIHAPESLEQAERARERFAYGEFLVHSFASLRRRALRALEHGAEAMSDAQECVERLEANLPFPLTGAQRRVIGEIARDLAGAMPMNRLVQGDVGSGKTLVAAAAMFVAARNHVQSALMAPTELLALQHAQKLGPLLMPFGIAVEPILGSQRTSERREALRRLAGGEAAVAVGTHALLTESTEFMRLGLVVIDEQHRFGVEQRARLRAKGGTPHTLHLTATPIPRTLAQTLLAGLDISSIDELPPGRTPIETFVLRMSRLDRAYRFIRERVEKEGRQAYVVCPAIERDEDDDTGLIGAVEEAARVAAGPLAGLRVGLLHGRMSAELKDRTMRRFSAGEIDVLVATTVVEVGVDVPNAVVMLVLDAHRYGLAQLHQLRGRVGRGGAASYCLLVHPDEAPQSARLDFLLESTDGFAIAERDLELRGGGQLGGLLQSGRSGMRYGDPIVDRPLFLAAAAAAREIFERDPELRDPTSAGLRSALLAEQNLRDLQLSS